MGDRSRHGAIKSQGRERKLLAKAHGRLCGSSETEELFEEHAEFSWTEKKGTRRRHGLLKRAKMSDEHTGAWVWIKMLDVVALSESWADRERWMGWIVKMPPTMGAVQEARCPAHFMEVLFDFITLDTSCSQCRLLSTQCWVLVLNHGCKLQLGCQSVFLYLWATCVTRT